MTPAEVAARTVGRPRSVEADAAILAATIDELVEVGFDELTIERVAARAGVGKATIYRRWGSKTELVVDAVGSVKPPPIHPDTGSTRDDLVEMLSASFGWGTDPDLVRLLVGMCMELQRNAEMGNLYRERVTGPRRHAMVEVLERGVERGELRPGLDADAVVDQLVGPLFYRQVIAATPVDRESVAQVVDLVLSGIRT
jgi:AcrR family transcriptional regulator